MVSVTCAPLPAPYYQDGGITIYHGDALHIVPRLARAERFGLLCTDPPYGIGVDRAATRNAGRQPGTSKAKRTTYAATNYDEAPPDSLLLVACVQACDESIIWGGHLFSLPTARGWLVWDKVTGDNAWGDCELAWTTLDQPVRLKRHEWAGMRQKHMGRNKEPRLHPGQKPVPLMHWCLGMVPGAKTVLDPFMGSGTTLRAAKDMGLVAVGIDRMEHCCEMAARRLSQEVLFA